MCWEQNETEELIKKSNEVCDECGQPTIDGKAIECCPYSPQQCEKCNWRPCDGSC